MGKAQEHEFNELHSLVTRELTDRVRRGEDCSTADIKAAIDWLSKNNVTGVASAGTPLKELADSLTEEDQAFLERMIQ
jgi:hypothetical protein